MVLYYTIASLNFRKIFNMSRIAVFTSEPSLLPRAEFLAAQLGLPFSSEADYLLILTAEGLGLQQTGDNSLPLFVNFISSKMHYRRQQLSIRKEALARALGLKNGTNPRIIDATTGLARDSFVIAALGFHVQMIERSPIIHALVSDGIERALQDSEVAEIAKRMHLIQSNAITYLQNVKEKPDIVYLDPMFPERKKSALSKKDMRIFHDVVGDDPDADQLLPAALACAKSRVVVKRPRLAVELAGIKPSFILEGSSSRFDVYLT